MIETQNFAAVFNSANTMLSVRFACAVGSQRKSLRALWLIVGSKLTDNVLQLCFVGDLTTKLYLKH
jgi:hypothetical protein